MKTLLGIGAFCVLFSTAQAQTTGGRTISLKPQAGRHDFLLELGGVKGESPDSIPPRPKPGFFIGAGALVAISANHHATGRTLGSGFTVNVGYAIPTGKGQLTVGANFSEVGAVATANQNDVHTRLNPATAKARYVGLPVQYLHFLGKTNRLFVGGGVYLGLLLPAVQRVASPANMGNATRAGLSFSTGVHITKGWLLKADYQFALQGKDALVSKPFGHSTAAVTMQFAIGPIIKIKPKGGAQTSGARRGMPAAKLYPRKQGSDN
jgi:hypothetical protein